MHRGVRWRRKYERHSEAIVRLQRAKILPERLFISTANAKDNAAVTLSRMKLISDNNISYVTR